LRPPRVARWGASAGAYLVLARRRGGTEGSIRGTPPGCDPASRSPAARTATVAQISLDPRGTGPHPPWAREEDCGCPPRALDPARSKSLARLAAPQRELLERGTRPLRRRIRELFGDENRSQQESAFGEEVLGAVPPDSIRITESGARTSSLKDGRDIESRLTGRREPPRSLDAPPR